MLHLAHRNLMDRPARRSQMVRLRLLGRWILLNQHRGIRLIRQLHRHLQSREMVPEGGLAEK